MGELSMGARREITKKYAKECASAGKKDKGRMLDELCGATGWSRANAHRALAVARARKGPARAVKRKPRGRGYSYNALKTKHENKRAKTPKVRQNGHSKQIGRPVSD